jgi:hypothetical protein
MNVDKRKAYRLLAGSQKERYHWEDQDIGGWIILRWILEEIGLSGMDWIGLAQDMDL